jgi:hypothetical protein
MIAVVVLNIVLTVGGVVVILWALRNDRDERQELREQRQELLEEILEEVASLRGALVASGAVAPKAKWPPGVDQPPPRPATAGGGAGAPPVDGAGAPPGSSAPSADDEPAPSTQPSVSRTIPAAVPSSATRTVSIDERVQAEVERLWKRLAPLLTIRAAVKRRWAERVRARADELGLTGETEPTDAQVDEMLGELLHAEAEVHPAEATAVAPIAVRIAEAAERASDDDGDVTLQQDGRQALLPGPSLDDLRRQNGVHQ